MVLYSSSTLAPVSCFWRSFTPASGLVRSVLVNWPNGKLLKKLLPLFAHFPLKNNPNKSSLPVRACLVRELCEVKSSCPYWYSWFQTPWRFTCLISRILSSKAVNCSCPSRLVWRWRNLVIWSWYDTYAYLKFWLEANRDIARDPTSDGAIQSLWWGCHCRSSMTSYWTIY